MTPMEITCNSCQTKLTIPDSKLPPGKKASFLCPKCRQRIHIDPGPVPESGPSGYNADEKPFDYIDENTRTALLCIRDGSIRQTVEKSLQYHGYYTITVEDAETALTRMKYHLFDVIVVADNFEPLSTNTPATILNHLKHLDIASRRKSFLVLISGRFRTMDRLMAFHESVNLIVSRDNIADVDKILSQGLKEHQQFYGVFNDTLKKLGKI